MAIKKVKEITAEEENFRIEKSDCGINFIRRDAVEPVPVGTLVVKVFRVVGYDKDCDGSLMARIENVGKDGEGTGWTENCVGVYPESTWAVDNADEIDNLTED